MPQRSLRTFYTGATDSVEDKVSDYIKHYKDHHVGEIERRRLEYAQVINNFYDLVTDFYEYGWGRHFHFATRVRGADLESALAAHQSYLADQLYLGPGVNVLDVGCGVGGPMSNIARRTGAFITGININRYQVNKGQAYLREAGLDRSCRLVNADFLHMPFVNEGFDYAYAIEATVHAPSRLQVYREIFRTLKPGGFFASYEWALTDTYDPNNPEHCRIKQEIETGNGIPSLIGAKEVDDALKAAGFQVCITRDRALDSDPDLPWYSFLSGKPGIDNFRHSEVGFRTTDVLVRLAERFHLVPTGTAAVSSILMRAAQALIAGGRLGIFSPMYFVLAQKPA